MVAIQPSVAGTLESSDIMITLAPPEAPGIAIELDSAVAKEFGAQIRRVIEATLREIGIDSVKVTAVDKGAMDCTIRARVRAAACRATGRKVFDWGGTAK